MPAGICRAASASEFIAMTLAQDTDLIVLDEPTTYLDIRACHETMELIRRLNEEAGKTIVMMTQVPYEGSDMEVYQVGYQVKEKYQLMEAYNMTLEALPPSSCGSGSDPGERTGAAAV